MKKFFSFKKSFKLFLIISVFIGVSYSFGHAASVTLSWEANTEDDLAGYKIYYDTDSGAPYNGSDASEGASPIMVTLDALSDASNPQFNLTGLNENQAYVFVVTAFDIEGLESDYSNEVSTELVTAPTSVSLVSDLKSPQAEGTTITFNATAAGGGGSYEYKFLLRNTQGVWTVAQDYSSENIYTWIAAPTINRIRVWARNAGATNGQVSKTVVFSTDTNPVSSVSLLSDLKSPQAEGTLVTFTATAAGGSGSYEYKFSVRDAEGVLTVAQDYSSENIYTWIATADINRINVCARNAGASDVQASRTIWFSTDTNPVTSVSLISDLQSPQTEGTQITFTAMASGGSGSYEYKFLVRNTEGVWAVAQDYSYENTFAWIAASNIDRIRVWARNAGTSDRLQALRSLSVSTSTD